MMNIATQETKQSTTCEGVSFTIRRLSRIQRSLRDLPIFEQRLKADELSARYWDLVKQREAIPAGDTDAIAAVNAQIVAVDYEFSLVNSGYIVPAFIRAGLVSIDGLSIDGTPVTPESLATNATPELDDLVREIYAECEMASGLAAAQRKNSPSPTTGQEPAAATTPNNTIAATAND